MLGGLRPIVTRGPIKASRTPHRGTHVSAHVPPARTGSFVEELETEGFSNNRVVGSDPFKS
jgi:hypothetical protein